LHALIQLVKDIRVSILNGTFESKVPAWLAQWQGNAERDSNILNNSSNNGISQAGVENAIS
jgi:hypothetical protein